MDIKVYINHFAEISEWLNRFPNLSFLKNVRIPMDDIHEWNVTNRDWGYNREIGYGLQVMFIGKTGYGKSTTLNKLVGKKVFDTSDVSVCTKELFNSMYRIDPSIPSFFILSDLPGVGESIDADRKYIELYKDMIDVSQVVVYLLRADQRDYAIDEMIFESLFNKSYMKEKVILAINFADKIEPLNRNGIISSEQYRNLERRVIEVSRIFNVPQKDILYYSAEENINIDVLVDKIGQKLKTFI